MTAHFDHFAPDPPCDQCALSQVCRVQQMLCQAYLAYIDNRPWEKMERHPNAQLFAKLYRVRTPEEHEKFERSLAERRERMRLKAAKRAKDHQTAERLKQNFESRMQGIVHGAMC